MNLTIPRLFHAGPKTPRRRAVGPAFSLLTSGVGEGFDLPNIQTGSYAVEWAA